MTRTTPLRDNALFAAFALVVVAAPILLAPLGAGYPDLMERFAIFGLFATGFNLLFGLTGYLSFGHAAFLGAGSYAAVWMLKLLGMNIIPALIFAVVIAGIFSLAIGYVSLRRSGIYFSILTLAFAQMCYSLAYSVLVPITNGETGLQPSLSDPRIFGISANPDGSLPFPDLFGLGMRDTWVWHAWGHDFQFNAGFYVCALALLAGFYLAMRIFRSPFGMMLKAVRTNQTRLDYTGISVRPYTLAAFVISGMYAGLAGGLMVIVDPLAGPERMAWEASGAVVLMTILGGTGTLLGPVLGAVLMNYMEAIFSSFNPSMLEGFYGRFTPDWLRDPLAGLTSHFVGDGWNLTVGIIFVLIVTFMPGGIMEGLTRLGRLGGGAWRRDSRSGAQTSARPGAAE